MADRILLFIHVLNNSGAPLSTLGMARILKKRGYLVEIWSLKDGALRESIEKEKIPVSIVGADTLCTPGARKRIKRFSLLIANTIETYRVVQLYEETMPTIWVIREGKNLPAYLRNRECYLTLKRSKSIYVISEYVKDYIGQTYKKRNVRILHNYVEDVYKEYESGAAKNKIENRPVKILYLGTVCKRKAQDVVIAAYKSLKEVEQKKCAIYFAGNHDEGESLYFQRFRKNVRSCQNLFYLGNIMNRDLLYQLICTCDVVGQVSRDDACSRAVLEACMMAKPVIISQNVGAVYMMDKRCGWIVKTGDPDALKEVLKRIIENPMNLGKMGEYARKAYLDTSTEEIYEKSLAKEVRNKIKKGCFYPLVYLAARVFNRAKRKYLDSPFHDREIFRGSRIVIYGAGDQGRQWRERLARTSYCKLALWIDQNYKNLPGEVKSPEDIWKEKFDFVIIAVFQKKDYEAIRSYLLELGVGRGQIKWCRAV